MEAERPVAVDLGDGRRVSALLDRPADARCAFAFAHGAGAGMRHAFMTAFTDALCRRGVAVLRYQFPFVEAGTKRPDPPATAHATVRAAVEAMRRECAGLPSFAGGKSFGGRMTSQADAAATLDVRGLVFVGFPLHAAKRPATGRAAHLAQVPAPMLFLQGTRDDLADLSLLGPIVEALDDRATLHVVDDADHAFHVRRASGSSDAEVLETMADVATAWMTRIVDAGVGATA